MPQSSSILVVLTTAPTDVAPTLAKKLVALKVVACVNIVPKVQSIYCWQGEICDEAEALLVMKTRVDAYSRLEQAICDNHPYDVPEIVALESAQVADSYLNWVTTSVDDCD